MISGSKSKKSQIEVFDKQFRFLAQDIRIPALLFAGLALAAWLLMSRTVVGRHLHALGGNAPAALYYEAGCVYSLALEGLTEQEKAQYARDYTVRAVDLLRRAAKADMKYIKKIKETGRLRDRDLDALRDRAEFKELLLELSQSKPKGK